MSEHLAVAGRTQGELLVLLRRWAEAGWLRRLDVAFARFIANLAPSVDAPALLAAAVLAQLEGRGHSCLDLSEWPPAAAGEFGLSAELVRELRGLDATARDALLAGLRACEAVYVVGEGSDAGQPLVLDSAYLYLRRYWNFERRVASQVRCRTTLPCEIDPTLVRPWLDRLFPDSPESGLDWQKVACAFALRAGFSVITGGPGTGKTFTAARLLAVLFAVADDPARVRVALAAPTGKAAARLKQSIDQSMAEVVGQLGESTPLAALAAHVPPARTLHALLGSRPDTRKLSYHAGNPLDVDVLIVDEASMVHLEMMADLLDAVPGQARVILLGDKDQLASVEAGAVLGDLCAGAQRGHYRSETAEAIRLACGMALPASLIDPDGSDLAQQVVMLRKSRRFSGDIGRLALAVNAGDAVAATEILGMPGALQWVPRAEPDMVVALALGGREGASGNGFTDYLALVRVGAATEHERNAWALGVLQAFDRFRVLCAVRHGPWGVEELNRAIEVGLRARGLIAAQAEWYEGRPVIVTRNDRHLGIFNGDIGIVLRSGAGQAGLRVYFASAGGVHSISVSRLAHVETAFALTVHKAQGSEFEHTVLALPAGGGIVRELIYTGITRARAAFTLLTERPEALSDGISRMTKRSSGLLDRIGGPSGR
ncbi:exodeoxyribonuclease V subunit alpha [Thiomonas sp. FB-Cd]|uniref:exodeoxyribonuclease V subunit alpha n=1 Tax=Thiomonas sp. FB-Cd TaxID=1158292 RepID=UPI000B013D77|nr:exodeoxyribonuclease V subunit alpha [Thiomonas sp. FB-Cd]